MENNSFTGKLINGSINRLKSLFNNPYKKVNISWIMLKYYKHLSGGKMRKHPLFDKYLYFYSPAELLHGLREIFIEEIYKQRLPSKAYIIDCGANIGLSVIYLKSQCSDSHIVAFEPDELNFDLLTRNIKSFGFENVSLRKEAVWKEETILQFSSEASMSSKIETTRNKNTVEIKAIRLKNLLDKNIDFLKIDIEGAEFEVLDDIKDKLYFVKNMFIEYHGTFKNNFELTKLIEIIDNAGFNYYIKEASCIYSTPFLRTKNPNIGYDLQLNLFCFRVVQ